MKRFGMQKSIEICCNAFGCANAKASSSATRGIELYPASKTDPSTPRTEVCFTLLQLSAFINSYLRLAINRPTTSLSPCARCLKKLVVSTVIAGTSLSA